MALGDPGVRSTLMPLWLDIVTSAAATETRAIFTVDSLRMLRTQSALVRASERAYRATKTTTTTTTRTFTNAQVMR